EYDLVAAPGVDPASAVLRWDGAQSLDVDPQGNLLVRYAGGTLVQKAPTFYQEGGDGSRLPVQGGYTLLGGDRFAFYAQGYDPTRPLVLDPALSYSTYLGGSGFDTANAVAVDNNGNAYIAGQTDSLNFPIVGGVQTATLDPAAFVTKLSADGRSLVYSTYLGGNHSDGANGIAVSDDGDAYVVGTTSSTDFPVNSPYQATLGMSLEAAFVARLNAAGDRLVMSTYLSGTAKN